MRQSDAQSDAAPGVNRTNLAKWIKKSSYPFSSTHFILSHTRCFSDQPVASAHPRAHTSGAKVTPPSSLEHTPGHTLVPEEHIYAC